MAPVAVLRTQGAGIETGRPVRRCLQNPGGVNDGGLV